MAKRAVITGVTGQDGSYLAELLLEKGYEVTGVVRRSSAPNLWRIEHLLDRVTLRPADLLDQLSLMRIVHDVRPHEFYNLAAMSFVPASWEQVALEAARQLDVAPRLKRLTTAEVTFVAARPRFCALSNQKLAAAGFTMPSWQDALRRWLASRNRPAGEGRVSVSGHIE